MELNRGSIASSRFKRTAGFTLVELLIGMSLSLMIMGAVLSSYIFMARNFTRSLGVSSASQPNLEAQDRHTLAAFAQDARMASGIVNPAATETLVYTVKFTLPTSAGSTTILYYYNGAASPRYLHSNDMIDDTAEDTAILLPSKSLSRVDLSIVDPSTHKHPSQILHSNLLTCVFGYFDASGNPYSSLSDYLIGVKQVALTFTAQAGVKENGTLTPVYQVASPRLLFRNKPLLP